MIQQLPKQVPRQRQPQQILQQFRRKRRLFRRQQRKPKQQFRSLPMHRKQHLRSSLWKKNVQGIPPQTGEKKMSCSKWSLRITTFRNLPRENLLTASGPGIGMITKTIVRWLTKMWQVTHKPYIWTTSSTIPAMILLFSERQKKWFLMMWRAQTEALHSISMQRTSRQISFRMIRIPQFMKITEWYTLS